MLDHVLVGPGGVVVLQTIPVHDVVVDAGHRFAGAATLTALGQSMSVLRDQVVDPIAAAASVLLEGWEVPVRAHNVLVGNVVGEYEDALRPEGVLAFVTGHGAPYSATHVQDLAITLEPLFALAPLSA
ncbi:hypothetical protein G5V59_27475 [Nocardioides sp. W3-2-3]|uniref:hypothetical protein n=1 Tax=Nocardioides convexus TaxID=2712224 RepID=UPI002418B3EB|nr:hypothetical protein [Nocardioides convexus]NHA02124.1 hypothetical protein [Nocardioides convexus]